MNALATYRGLLSNRPLTLLLGGEFVSAIGDWLYYVAILIVIYEETADPLVLGLFGARPRRALRLPVDPGRDRRRPVRPTARPAGDRRHARRLHARHGV